MSIAKPWIKLLPCLLLHKRVIQNVWNFCCPMGLILIFIVMKTIGNYLFMLLHKWAIESKCSKQNKNGLRIKSEYMNQTLYLQGNCLVIPFWNQFLGCLFFSLLSSSTSFIFPTLRKNDCRWYRYWSKGISLADGRSFPFLLVLFKIPLTSNLMALFTNLHYLPVCRKCVILLEWSLPFVWVESPTLS